MGCVVVSCVGLRGNFSQLNTVGENSQRPPKVRGRAVVLAGSCSEATRKQLKAIADSWPVYAIVPGDVIRGEVAVSDIIQWCQEQSSECPVVVYSSADPSDVQETQSQFGRERSGQIIESLFGEVAQGLVGDGFDKLIVAGGETSGAVVNALGVLSMRICQEIDPGVPWTEAPCELHGEKLNLALALKSGNFGSVDFFEKAFALLP